MESKFEGDCARATKKNACMETLRNATEQSIDGRLPMTRRQEMYTQCSQHLVDAAQQHIASRKAFLRILCMH